MGLWGAYHKDSKYLCSSFAVKAGGGLTFEGGVFSGEYGICNQLTIDLW